MLVYMHLIHVILIFFMILSSSPFPLSTCCDVLILLPAFVMWTLCLICRPFSSLFSSSFVSLILILILLFPPSLPLHLRLCCPYVCESFRRECRCHTRLVAAENGLHT